jgi:PadR family transcriptional regulator PadR
MRNQNDQSAHDELETDPERAHHHGHRPDHHAGPGHGHHYEKERAVQALRNFWHEWGDERHHHGRDMDIQIGQALSPKEMEAWREFFHKTFGTWPEEHWIFGGRRFSPWHQGIDSFNPFVANLLSKGGGLLPLYVLHLVAQKPRYGNEIMDLLTERTHGQWVSNPGAIYPLLALLEREGFITGVWEDPDKRTIRVYTITRAGLDEVSRIKSIVSPKIEETILVLQDLLEDLQSQPAESDQTPAEGSETGDRADEEAAGL